jgi:hypothetical protein
MRAFDGQFSDNRPIRRSALEKKKLLAELKETLANLKPQSAPSLRSTIVARIKEIEAELAAEPPPRSAAPRGEGPRADGPRGDNPRRRDLPPRR